MKHPIQPLERAEDGVLRFKENKIVRWMLDNGNIDLNKIAIQFFPKEEEEHFAQLIGYSLSGAGGLSYFSNETYLAAELIYKTGVDEKDARIKVLEDDLNEIKNELKRVFVTAFGIPPDDLEGR